MNEMLIADIPLKDLTNDRLGYAPFAEKIAQSICKMTSDEGLVFAIYGPWGTGKTTCINFIQEYISSYDNKPIILRFNPWWFTGDGDLLKQFFKELKTVLGKTDRFKSLANTIAILGGIVSEIPEPTGISKLFGKGMSSLTQQESTVFELKELISKELLEQKKSILIIIDDIDRLSADEIISIFRVVKAVADFPKTFYLLSLDKDVVVRILSEIQKIPGEEYLEKIVQVPFELPLPDKVALRRLFFESLSTIFGDTPEYLLDNTYLGNIYWEGIDPFVRTIRNIKRLLNTLKVTYPSVKGEVNPADFLAIETLRVFCSEVYYIIRANPDMFTGYTFRAYDDHSKESVKTLHESWLNNIDTKYRENVKQLLIRLFPKVKSVFENYSFGYEWESTWRRNLNVCSGEIFPIYFRFSIPEGQISSTEMSAILSLIDTEDFANKLIELSKIIRPDGSTLLSAFLERLEDYTNEGIGERSIVNVLASIFDVGDQLLVPEDEAKGMFGYDNDTRMGRIMFQLLKRYNTQEERFNVLHHAISNGKAVSTISSQIVVLGQQHGKYGAQEKSDEQKLINLEQLEILETIAIRKIRESAQNEELLTLPNLARVMYFWKACEGEDEPRKWIEQSSILEDDEKLVEFLTNFLSKVHSQSMGDLVTTESWRLPKDSIKPFVDPEIVLNRFETIISHSPVWLTGKKLTAVKTFIKDYDAKSEW